MNFDELKLETGDWLGLSRKYFSVVVEKQHFLSVYSSAIASVAAIILAIIAWIPQRKTPRALVVVAIALTTTILFAQRSRIRPSSGVRDYVFRAPIAPGIVDHFHIWRVWGPTPLPSTPRIARTRITGDYGSWEHAEVRTSETPSSMGLLIHYRDWDAVSRWSYERELDNASTSLASRTMATPSIEDYHSPIFFWLINRASGSTFQILAELITQSDGTAICAFALPSDVRTAAIKSLTGNAAVITWATGSMKLSLTKKDLYSTPSAEIPSDVLRQIAAQGGIMSVTFDHPVERRYGRVWIETREAKS
jgi:hypothetical protein